MLASSTSEEAAAVYSVYNNDNYDFYNNKTIIDDEETNNDDYNNIFDGRKKPPPSSLSTSTPISLFDLNSSSFTNNRQAGKNNDVYRDCDEYDLNAKKEPSRPILEKYKLEEDYDILYENVHKSNVNNSRISLVAYLLIDIIDIYIINQIQ